MYTLQTFLTESRSPEFLKQLYDAVDAYTSNNHEGEAGQAGLAFLAIILKDPQYEKLVYEGDMYRAMVFDGDAPSEDEIVKRGKGKLHSFAKTQEGVESFLEDTGDIEFGEKEHITDLIISQTGRAIDVSAVYNLLKRLTKLNLATIDRAAEVGEVIGPYAPPLHEVDRREIENPYFDDEDDGDDGEIPNTPEAHAEWNKGYMRQLRTKIASNEKYIGYALDGTGTKDPAVLAKLKKDVERDRSELQKMKAAQ